MCLEIFAAWALSLSHRHCCMLFKLKDVRFVIIADFLELAVITVVLCLYQIKYVPVLIIADCLSLFLRIYG
jgi:hypothetical protein